MDLGETAQNKSILEKVFGSKDNEKFIGDKYNIYMEILKGLNQSSVFKKVDSNFMLNQVKGCLREYFDSVNEKEFSKEFLNVEYLKELSYYFFEENCGKSKNKHRKAEKYSL